MKLTGGFFETAPCFCVGKDVPLLQVVNRMHNILPRDYQGKRVNHSYGSSN